MEHLAHIQSQRDRHLKNRKLKREARKTLKGKIQVRNSEPRPQQRSQARIKERAKLGRRQRQNPAERRCML